jgi:poly[(R)-3-hydroxyalkanoate] polymerase subunit PhaC
MNPFTISPDQIDREISDFNSKLTQGLNTLSKLGEIELGVSEKECVYEEDKLRLYRYKSRTEKQCTVPVLIVYALVNRPYMADLQEGRSLIQGLLDAGLDIYLIDWGYADSAERYLTLDDYINGYIDRCVDHICNKHKLKNINLLGVCQGGAFSLCYAALHQEKVKNLITTVTPVDFHTKNDLLSNLVRHIDIDLCVDTLGNIPGEYLNWAFLSLKPYRLMAQKYIDLVDILDDEEKARNFMRMEKWIFDSPDQAGEAYRQFIKQFYQENALVKGTVKIGDQLVDLEDIKIPILNIYARDDHLVPPDSSKALAGCISSEDYTEMEFPGGHIGIYVSAKAQALLPPTIGKWIWERS